MTHPSRLIIASRESRLALVQSESLRLKLAALYPEIPVRILGMTTQGDQILDRPLAAIGGKGLFIKELETALLDGRADLAVHSMKDVPAALPDGFALAVVGEREDARDAFVSNQFDSLADLPAGAVVGTSSLRRECWLCIHHPALKIASLRGNVETRLRKLDQGEYAAIILAAAGLTRLGLAHRIRTRLDLDQSLPAVGQGALAIEYLSARNDIAALLTPLESVVTSACVRAERAFGAALQGSCEVPLAGHARLVDGQLHLHGFLGLPDGSRHVAGIERGSPDAAVAIGARLGERLMAAGGREILAQLAGQLAPAHPQR